MHQTPLRLVSLCAMFSGAILLCANVSLAQEQDDRTVGKKFHESIIKDAGFYERILGFKALAACIDWKASTPNSVQARYRAYPTPIKGQATVSVGRLANSALYKGRGAQTRSQAPCDCQVIDRNGSNVLKVPKTFLEQKGSGPG